MFQFPSNGKDFPNYYNKNRTRSRSNVSETGSNVIALLLEWKTVSIPFKREGLSEHRMDLWIILITRFQFPSNGKDCRQKRLRFIKPTSFNSLQTGRTFRTEVREVRVYCMSFQFPSNGKDSERMTWMADAQPETFSFNSLQTGRTFRTMSQHTSIPSPICNSLHAKDFPSNDTSVSIPFKREGLSELNVSNRRNSLQAGSYFPKHTRRCTCFNSLQTGRTFRTN